MTTYPAYRGLASASRQRVQLVLAAGLLGVVATSLAVALRLLAGTGPEPLLVAAAAALSLPLAGAAGTSVRLRRESARVLAVSTELAAVAVVALLGLGVLVLVLGRLPDGDQRDLVVPALVATGTAALLYTPVRSWLTGAARRTATAARRTPEDVLETFGDRSTRGVPVEELLLQLAEALRASLGMRGVEIWTGDRAGLQRLIAVPHRAAPVTDLTAAEVDVLRRAGVAGDAWLRLWLPRLLVGRAEAQVRVAPTGHGGEVLGLVVVERAPDDERITGPDERRLGEVSRRLGVVLHNRQLDSALQATLDDLRRTNDELRASRARLVAAADAERRRIERDIHDGAQQHLVALAVNLGLARASLADEPAAAAELLDELAGDVRDTIAQVRDLAHGIYPPLLLESGLGEALRATATRHPSPVEVSAEVGRHDPEVEAAVYFCCLEALQNAAKHAPSATVSVRLWQDEGLLHFDVTDDGPGLADAAGTGHGFQNMADRLGAIGGLVTWSSPPGGGVRVAGQVPRRGSDG